MSDVRRAMADVLSDEGHTVAAQRKAGRDLQSGTYAALQHLFNGEGGNILQR